jgi:hypothetical protein
MKCLRSIVALLPLAVGSLAAVGCGAEGYSDTASEEDLASVAESLTGPTVFFQSYTYLQSNGGAQVERYVDCGPDQVLSGIGARVSGGDFLDFSVYCRDILSNGALSINEAHFQAGGPGEEKSLHATNATVVVGGGAIVSGDNVVRIVLRTCPWIPATKRIDVINCSDISTTPGSFSAEQFLDTHTGTSAANKPRTLATGAGMTATNDNVFAVRMSAGLLK